MQISLGNYVWTHVIPLHNAVGNKLSVTSNNSSSFCLQPFRITYTQFSTRDAQQRLYCLIWYPALYYCRVFLNVLHTYRYSFVSQSKKSKTTEMKQPFDNVTLQCCRGHLKPFVEARSDRVALNLWNIMRWCIQIEDQIGQLLCVSWTRKVFRWFDISVETGRTCLVWRLKN